MDVFVKEGSERRVCGARWIPDRHLTVKLLESPENEDGYMSVHFAFPIPAGSRLLFLPPCPPFLVFLLLLLFSFLSHASSSSSTLRFLFSSPCRRLYPVGKEDARSKRRRRCVAVAVADGTDAADGAFAMPCRTVA